MIVVVDNGLSNLLSVAKALESVAGRINVRVSGDSDDLLRAEHLVLPGVGNFGSGMQTLCDKKLIEPLRELVLGRKIPFLGICLGMQLLAEVGEESGECAGLGWIPGRVRKLNCGDLKLPHIGWNQIEVLHSSPLLPPPDVQKDYYFVHSYVFDCPEKYILARCDYGESFAAVVRHENIIGTQFHPEKSREAGLEILRRFIHEDSCSTSEWFLSSS